MVKYLEKLKSKSNDSKYEKWYFSIIRRASNRTLEGYGEKHHILPRCFDMGGEKGKLNIVKLTAKEHYICHQLLVKMIVDTELNKKCYYAIWRLSNRLKINSSKLYETNKLVVRDLISKQTTEYFKDPEARKRASDLTKEQMKDPVFYATAVETLRKAHENIDHSTKEWTERSFNSPEALRKSKEYSQSEENRKFCSERELSKGKEVLSAIGKKRHQALKDSFGSEEAFIAHMSNINKGRKRIINMITFEVKNTRDTELPKNWLYWKSLDKQTKELLRNK